MCINISDNKSLGSCSCVSRMEATLSVVILAAIAVVVASAPALTDGPVPAKTVPEQQQQWEAGYYRDRRSQYSQYPQYVTPCAAAAAASAPIPAIAPAAYQVNLSPYHPYSAPHSYYSPHYRMMELEPEETMSYSDMDFMTSEQLPMARYAGYAQPSHPPANYAPVVPAMGPVYSVFPNAKTGGCSVPLLFSCAPSIVPGHLVQSASHHGYGDSYRGVEAAAHHDAAQTESHEDTVQEHLTPVHEPSHTTIVHQ